MDPMLVLFATPILALIAAFVFGYVLPRRRRHRLRHSPIALAPFGHALRPAIPPRPSRPAEVATPAPVPPPSPVPPEQAIPIEERGANVAEEAAEEGGRVLRLQVAGDRRDFAHDVRANTVRRDRPFDGTLQFLPGRLEVVEGRDVGHEVKFVRTPGPDGTSITFGRSEGPLYRHVQLFEATVSRQHARMSLDGKAWSLTNLSATNPVVVNGAPLEGEGSTVVLRDADRIEMGEVVFRFVGK